MQLHQLSYKNTNLSEITYYPKPQSYDLNHIYFGFKQDQHTYIHNHISAKPSELVYLIVGAIE
jgi:hypothetical protein